MSGWIVVLALCSVLFVVSDGEPASDFDFHVTKGSCRVLWTFAAPEGIRDLDAPLAIGDINRDGVSDLVFSGMDRANRRLLLLVRSGKTGAPLATYSVPGKRSYVSGAADLNRDQIAEVIIVQPKSTTGYILQALNPVTGLPLWRRSSDINEPFFGERVRIVGDVNGDGISDLMVTSPHRELPEALPQSVFVLSGMDGSNLDRFQGPQGASPFFGAGMATLRLRREPIVNFLISDLFYEPQPGSFHSRLWAISGSSGRNLWSIAGKSYSLFADFILETPDLNRDGTSDLMIAAPNAGRSYRGIVRATSGESGATIWTYTGTVPTGQLGRSLVDVGDLNRDGISDVAAGAPAALPPVIVRGYPGSFVVLNGRNGKVLVQVQERLSSPEAVSSRFGRQMTAPGDLNGDGSPDLVVSAPWFGDGGLIVAFSLN